MADTIPDVETVVSSWTDIYSTTGIAIGRPVYLINKSSSAVLVFINATAPALDEEGGVPLYPGDSDRAWAKVSSGATGIWIKSLDTPAIISVQEV